MKTEEKINISYSIKEENGIKKNILPSFNFETLKVSEEVLQNSGIVLIGNVRSGKTKIIEEFFKKNKKATN